MYLDLETAKKYRVSYFLYPGISINEDVILEIVAKEFNVKVKDIKGRTRLREVVEARKASAFLLREIFKYKVEYIATILNRDHSAISYYLTESSTGSWQSLICFNEELREKHDKLCMKLESLSPERTKVSRDGAVSKRLTLKAK